jgi:N-acetylmuramic acid 6-phosphate etherase
VEVKEKITEQPSHYDHLEKMSVDELLRDINREDALVAEAVRRVIPQIGAFVEAVEPRMRDGGRLF